MATAPQSLTFRGVLGVREFRWLWLANVQSLLGDQLARVAISVIAFDATRSGFITSAVYAMTFLPAVIGTPLGVIADRYPRRTVLVSGDLLRAALLAAMAVPGLPWPWLVPLIAAVVVVGAPWKAAESALIADVLSGEGYVIGSGLRLATGQGAQLLGFASGGLAVALLGGSAALLVDAVTFAASAALIRAGVTWRPAPERPQTVSSLWLGVVVVWRSPRLRRLAQYAWLGGAFVVPEGLAAPVAANSGHGAAAVGYLLASMPLGLLIGSIVFVRWVPARRRRRSMPVLAALTGVPLMACVVHPPIELVFALWALAGVGMAYQVQAMTDFVRTCAGEVRGQAIAFASSGLLACQGVGLVLGGAVAQVTSPLAAVATAGATGAILAVAITAGRGVDRARA